MEDALQHHLQDYLQNVFGLEVTLNKINETPVPFYLRERYFFLNLEILNRSFVTFWARKKEHISPKTIKKDAERLQQILHTFPIWISPRIATYERRKLIEYRVPFIIPGTQTYLPDMLLDLREHFQAERKGRSVTQFSPATQHILLNAFYQNTREIGAFARQATINYSSMTFSRVIGELQDAGLIETERQGRNKRAWFALPWREIWEKSLPKLRNPIRRRLYVDRLDILLDADIPRAGMSALSAYSMLNPPERPVYAAPSRFPTSFAGKTSWTDIEAPHRDEAEAELELWAYHPFNEGGFSGCLGCVDPLSLYLSLNLQDKIDERTQKALDDLLDRTLSH